MPDQFKKFAMIKMFTTIQNNQCHQAFLQIKTANSDKIIKKIEPATRKLNSVVSVEIQYINTSRQDIISPESLNVQKYQKKNRINLKSCKASWDLINKFERFDYNTPTFNNVPEMRRILAQQKQDREKIKNHSLKQQSSLRQTYQNQISLYHPVFILLIAFLIYLGSSIQQKQL